MSKIINKIGTATNLIINGNFSSVRNRVLKNVLGKNYRSSEFKQYVDVDEFRPKIEEALLFLKNNSSKDKPVGDYLEFGVSHGSSMSIMFETVKKFELEEMRLFGFDSFEGLPDVALTDDDGHWKPGDYYAKEKNTIQFLTKKGIDWNRVKLTKGWFKDTLKPSFIKKHKIEKASVIMIDCDLYIAAKEALTFCAPLIKDKTIIIFDDWNSAELASRNLGEKKAFNEFLKENPQFESKDFSNYSFEGYPNGEIKLVSLKKK